MFRIIPFALLLLTACKNPSDVRKKPTPDSAPNIILITSDQQRKGALGVYGNDLIHTVHLDALAADGIVFDISSDELEGSTDEVVVNDDDLDDFESSEFDLDDGMANNTNADIDLDDSTDIDAGYDIENDMDMDDFV